MAAMATALVSAFVLPWLASARLGMTATELTERNFEQFVSEYDRLLIDFYDPGDPEWQEQQRALQEALLKVRSFGNNRVAFAKVDASKETGIAKRVVPNGRYPQLVWFAHGKSTQYHRTLRSPKMIADFVLALDRPSVTEIRTLGETGDYNRAVLAEIPKNSPLYKIIDAVALRHMDTVAFTFFESSKGTISWVTDGKLDVQYQGPAEVDALDKWVNGQMPLKTEEVPEGELAMEDGIHVIVGKNFEEKVFQKDKDVMLLVHAPWCGFCKKLLPKWKEFSRAVAGVTHLMVAQIDGDRNQSPLPGDFDWHAFPTIFHVRAGEKAPAVYRGNRTAESLLAFARERSSQPMDLANGNTTTDALYDL